LSDDQVHPIGYAKADTTLSLITGLIFANVQQCLLPVTKMSAKAVLCL